MFQQDKEQFQQPNKEVGAEVFQNRSVSEIQRSEAIWESKKQRRMAKEFCLTLLHKIHSENSISGLWMRMKTTDFFEPFMLVFCSCASADMFRNAQKQLK